METATLLGAGRIGRAVDWLDGHHPRLWLGLLGALLVVTVIGFFVLPTYPSYDSYYSMVWGRDLLHGHLPDFAVYRAPTEHPLSVFFAAALAVFGVGADRVFLFLTLLSFVVMVGATFRIAQLSFSPIVGFVAALLLATRFDFPFLAIRGYVDVPYMALVLVAAALEIKKPKRGVSVMSLLVAAGLLRPEAWILIGLYYLYIAWDADWPRRIKYAFFAAVAPIIWFGFDALVTGDPLYSLHATKELASELDRQLPLSQLPSELPSFFNSTVKLPVAVVGLVGFVIALFRFRRQMLVPAVLLFTGVFTFFGTAAIGLSAIARYLMIPSVALCIFAAVTLAGFVVKPRTRYWRAWAVVSLLCIALGVFYTAGHAPVFTKFENEIAFQGDIHTSFKKTISDPTVQQALKKCGPLNVPTHKFVPEGRWILNVPPKDVIPRSQKGVTPKYGVAIYVFGPTAVGRYAESFESDPVVTFVPADGYVPVASSRAQYTVAYISCPKGVTLQPAGNG